MKVAHVLQWLEMGGGEMLALRLAERQRQQGHQVAVVALSSAGPLGAAFQRSGIEVQVVSKRPGIDPRLPPRLLVHFLRDKRGVIHTHDTQSLVYAAAMGKLAGARVVHSKHGDTVERSRRLLLRQAAARFVDAFVTVSDSTAETALRLRETSRDKVCVIPNGVDTQAFKPDGTARRQVRQELGITAQSWVVGTVGRLDPVKNQVLLLRAMAPLLEGDETALVIAGEGALRDELERLAAELGVEQRVVFVGRRSDVARLMCACDVFAMSSRTEGLPLVVLEAMACGLPVVSTAVGSIASVVEDGRGGLVVPEGDEDEMRSVLKRLASDRALAAKMGLTARERACAEYSFEKMADSYMHVYLGS